MEAVNDPLRVKEGHMRIDANIHLHYYEMRSGYITWTLWTFNDPFHAKEGHMRIEANIQLD